MIFVTLGSQLPFDRLLRAVDNSAHLIPGTEIIVQTERGNYHPVHVTPVPFITPALFRKYMQDAELVISHAGIGTILAAGEMQKKLILFPRFGSLNETRNDHQIATCKRMAEKYALNVAYNEEELAKLINQYTANELLPMRFVPEYAGKSLIHSLENYMAVKK